EPFGPPAAELRPRRRRGFARRLDLRLLSRARGRRSRFDARRFLRGTNGFSRTHGVGCNLCGLQINRGRRAAAFAPRRAGRTLFIRHFTPPVSANALPLPYCGEAGPATLPKEAQPATPRRAAPRPKSW